MTAPDRTIGIVGLGLMGHAFARRLTALGHAVIGHDLVPERVEAARALGVTPAASPADLAARCGIVLVSVTTTAAVAAVIEGPDGILAGIGAKPTVLVDLSTTEIDTTRRLAAALAASGIGFLDAPVSGGPASAETGTLAIMAGGEETSFEAARPVLEALGHVTLMGAAGAGQATKLVNQTLVLTNYCVMAEALRLAEAYGVDATRVPAALAPGHAGSNLLPVLFARMIPADFTPRGYARQILKDLEMLDRAAADRHLAMPMASQALTLFRMLAGAGKGELDGSAIVTLLPRAPDV